MANREASLIGSDGKRFLLEPGKPVRLGRSADNDIILSDRSVSRHHALIGIEDNRCTIEDLGSHNGTFVAGSRIDKAELKEGDRIRLGDVELTVSNSIYPTGHDASCSASSMGGSAFSWWRHKRKLVATAGLAVVACATLLALRHGSSDQTFAPRDQGGVGLASLTADRNNFQLPNASSVFIGHWGGTIPRIFSVPSGATSDADLYEGIGFYQANQGVVMSVASYVQRGATVASMKARAIDPSHVVLEEEYLQKDPSGRTSVSRETIEYSPVSIDQLHCKVTYALYPDSAALPSAQTVYEGILSRVTSE